MSNKQNQQKKLDLRTATYEEIFAEWSSQGTSEKYNFTGICMESIKEYFSQLSN